MPLSPSQRLALINRVNALVPADFDRLVFALNVPRSVIPSDKAAPGDRSNALLQWVEGTTGCGMDEFRRVLSDVVQVHPPGPDSQDPNFSENQIQQDTNHNEDQSIRNMNDGQVTNIRVSEGGHVTLTHEGNRLSLAAIPSLLPYLPNRTEQVDELAKAVEYLKALNHPHPLVCIVHGDESQSHDQFLERLREVSLPNLLSDQNQIVPKIVKTYSLKWPKRLRSLKALPDRLCRNLADSVTNYRFADLEQINNTLCKQPYPAVIHMRLFSEDWHSLGFGLLPEILKFWQQWPALKPDQILIICVFIKYQTRRPIKKRKWWWVLNLFATLRRFFRYQRCHRLNLKISQQLNSLAQSGLQQFDRLIGVVLPKLNDIDQRDVEEWAIENTTKEIIKEAFDGQLGKAVRDMFDQWELKTATRTMSMEDAASQLIEILKAMGTNRGTHL